MRSVTKLPIGLPNKRWILPPYVFPVFVFVSSVFAFLPTLQSGFIGWGNYEDLIQNPYYRGLSWNNLRWMFTTFHTDNYRPLTWLTFSSDYALWGMNPVGYHLTSLLLHGVNALLAYFIAGRLLRLAFPISAASQNMSLRAGASFAALVFSVHPLRTEAVAWLSARGHLLAALFFLSTIVCYLRAANTVKDSAANWFWLASALILYSLSILSQPSGITLPLVLLILDVYPLKRWGPGPVQWFGRQSQRVWWEKVPFLLLAVAAGLTGRMAKQNKVFAAGDLDTVRRLALTLYGLTFYGWKTLVPVGLSPGYEVRFHFDPWDWHFLISGLTVTVVSVVVFRTRHRWPVIAPSWFYYVLILGPYVGFVLPVIGNVENGRQITADRYSYLACLPWCVLAGACLHSGWRGWSRQRRRFGILILGSAPFVAILVTLMVLTWRQTQIWHDSYSLWAHAVEVTDRSESKSLIAHDHLGAALGEQGKLDEAIAHFSAALRISPYYAQAHNNLGVALGEQGKLDEAIAHFSAALRISPSYQQAHDNLERALAKKQKLNEAVAQYSEAPRIDPTDHFTK